MADPGAVPGASTSLGGRIRIDVLSKEIGFVQNDSSEFSQENDGSKTINANDNNRFSGAVAHAA